MGNGVEACPLVGWWQGVYRLSYDAGRDTFTVADHAGRPVVRIDDAAGGLVASVSAVNNDEAVADALTLGEFRTVVRAAVQ